MPALLLTPARTGLPTASRPALAAGAIMLLAVVARLVSGWTTPLGFDETFSAVIASQPTFSALVSWCLHEIGGPVYYGVLWLWAQVAGTSVAALRAPSMIFSLAAPLAIARWGHPDRTTRLYWAALLALWLPALEPATNARCYAMLMLETTAQAILFRRLLDEPSRLRALAWTSVSALAVLTHYHAAVIGGIQGLIFLALRPRAALRCWPALIALLPVAGWMHFHLPLLRQFATQGAWYPALTWYEVLYAPEKYFDSALIGDGVVMAAVLGLANARYGLRRIDRYDAAVALSGLTALAMVIAIGMLQPSFHWRYTTMFGPAILLGIAVGVRQAGKSVAMLPALVLVLFAVSDAGRIARQLIRPVDDVRYNLNLGWPSQWLVLQHATRTGFLWDSPTGRISQPDRIAEVIGFGPRQAGHPVAVVVLPQPAGERPADTVERAVAAGRIDSLIWLADRTVPGTHAVPDAAMLRRHRWSCEDFGGAYLSMLTCRAPLIAARD